LNAEVEIKDSLPQVIATFTSLGGDTPKIEFVGV
jgi:hypothetical protein